ncbi:MAG: hypothetical protein M4D80_11565 [Myxococcota bacterium]|nr:hypothetical protein [Myxococcota bacterium]
MTKKTPPPPPAQKLPEKEETNVVRKELEKGEARPDGPGDETTPVKPEPA